MRISERYRQIVEGVTGELSRLQQDPPEGLDKALRVLANGAEELADWVESVGEIPQIQLEQKLSPVLLKAHGHLDRARVIFEQADLKRDAEALWGLEQQIYRLLNDL